MTTYTADNGRSIRTRYPWATVDAVVRRRAAGVTIQGCVAGLGVSVSGANKWLAALGLTSDAAVTQRTNMAEYALTRDDGSTTSIRTSYGWGAVHKVVTRYREPSNDWAYIVSGTNVKVLTAKRWVRQLGIAHPPDLAARLVASRKAGLDFVGAHAEACRLRREERLRTSEIMRRVNAEFGTALGRNEIHRWLVAEGIGYKAGGRQARRCRVEAGQYGMERRTGKRAFALPLKRWNERDRLRRRAAQQRRYDDDRRRAAFAWTEEMEAVAARQAQAFADTMLVRYAWAIPRDERDEHRQEFVTLAMENIRAYGFRWHKKRGVGHTRNVKSWSDWCGILAWQGIANWGQAQKKARARGDLHRERLGYVTDDGTNLSMDLHFDPNDTLTIYQNAEL